MAVIEPKQRPCLMCLKNFKSESDGNRRCYRCLKKCESLSRRDELWINERAVRQTAEMRDND